MKMHLRGGKKDILVNKYTFSKSSPSSSLHASTSIIMSKVDQQRAAARRAKWAIQRRS